MAAERKSKHEDLAAFHDEITSQNLQLRRELQVERDKRIAAEGDLRNALAVIRRLRGRRLSPEHKLIVGALLEQ